MEIEFGNIDTKENGDRGWIMGQFEKLKGTPFHTKEFEIKWSKHPKGDKKDKPKENKVAKSFVILVRGRVKINFPESSKDCILEKEGDYVFFGPGVTHFWEVLEEALVITIRWPSLPNDQR